MCVFVCVVRSAYQALTCLAALLTAARTVALPGLTRACASTCALLCRRCSIKVSGVCNHALASSWPDPCLCLDLHPSVQASQNHAILLAIMQSPVMLEQVRFVSLGTAQAEFS